MTTSPRRTRLRRAPEARAFILLFAQRYCCCPAPLSPPPALRSSRCAACLKAGECGRRRRGGHVRVQGGRRGATAGPPLSNSLSRARRERKRACFVGRERRPNTRLGLLKRGRSLPPSPPNPLPPSPAPPPLPTSLALRTCKCRRHGSCRLWPSRALTRENYLHANRGRVGCHVLTSSPHRPRSRPAWRKGEAALLSKLLH